MTLELTKTAKNVPHKPSSSDWPRPAKVDTSCVRSKVVPPQSTATFLAFGSPQPSTQSIVSHPPRASDGHCSSPRHSTPDQLAFRLFTSSIDHDAVLEPGNGVVARPFARNLISSNFRLRSFLNRTAHPSQQHKPQLPRWHRPGRRCPCRPRPPSEHCAVLSWEQHARSPSSQKIVVAGSMPPARLFGTATASGRLGGTTRAAVRLPLPSKKMPCRPIRAWSIGSHRHGQETVADECRHRQREVRRRREPRSNGQKPRVRPMHRQKCGETGQCRPRDGNLHRRRRQLLQGHYPNKRRHLQHHPNRNHQSFHFHHPLLNAYRDASHHSPTRQKNTDLEHGEAVLLRAMSTRLARSA